MNLRSVLAAILGLAASVPAQARSLYPDDAGYAANVPTFESVLGHAIGERIVTSAEAERYARALADASDRVRFVPYGASWEGKPLYYLVVGAAERLATLHEVQAGLQAIADPRGRDAAAVDALCDTLPVVTWLAYSVHGNEISCTDAALHAAYHLAAADDDELAARVRRESLVVIDPVQNPDGRDRFVQWFRTTRGRWPDADQQSAEHNEAWPRGRSNHYLFDMNRDWFAMTQIETRARVAAYQQWFPQVFVDVHEMGSNSSYYFPPPAEPLNPEMSAAQVAWLETFGRGNAAWFDRMKFDYFTREVFDAFYPGYGEGWPTFHGAIGMTYEQASVRGLVVERDDGVVLDYADSVQRHFIASLATADTAARNRRDLLRSFLAHRRGGARRTEGVDAYVLPRRPAEAERTDRLAALLVAQGIDVRRTTAAGSVRPVGDDEDAEVAVPGGAYWVPADQPAGHLARTLLEPQQDMPKEFLDKQAKRRERRESVEVYDMTGWSLPALYDVECVRARGSAAGGLDAPAVERVASPPDADANGGIDGGVAGVAYVVPGGTRAATRLGFRALRDGLRVHAAHESFRIGDARFPAGSLVIKVRDNPDDLHARLETLAVATGARVTAYANSWVDEGPQFGSNEVRALVRPRIALLWNRPTRSDSAGWMRYVLERQLDQPVTVLNGWQLPSVDLSRYNVLVLPRLSGRGELDRAGSRVAAWVRAGGTLLAFGEAVQWLTQEDIGLLASEREFRKKPKQAEGGDEAADGGGDEVAKAATDAKRDATEDDSPSAEDPPAGKPFDLSRAIQPDRELPDSTPGALMRVELDPEHWLAFGYPRHEVPVVVSSRNVFTPIKLDRGRNVGVYAKRDELLVSGFAWPEKLDQLAQKAYLVHQPQGRGHVVAFAEDPNWRAFAHGLERLVGNAILYGTRRDVRR